MRNPNQLGDYLKARRGRVTPADIGLPPGRNRRVPGLRREEVALHAGLSVDYYTRLEQGREQHPSPSVLTALARTLRLEPDAQRYLFAIATPGPRPRRDGQHVSDSLLTLIEEWPAHPALLIDGGYDIVAGNQLGYALYSGHAHSDNVARLMFLDPDARTFFREWEAVAHSCVASMRASVGHDPNNPDLMKLIGELSMHSTDFSRLWAKAEVREKTSARLLVHHPVVGDLDLVFESMFPGGARHTMLKIYRAEPGSESAEKLAVLGSLTADEPLAVDQRNSVDTSS